MCWPSSTSDLDFASSTAMVRAIRTIQPEIPVIVASVHDEDRPAVEELRAQAFIKKPYLAKDLILLIEETIQRGYDPLEVATQKSLAQTLEAREKEDLVDPLLEASRSHPDRLEIEPPISADDSTISEVIEHRARSRSQPQDLHPSRRRSPITHPGDANAPSVQAEPIPESDEPFTADTTPALETLSATLGTASLDSLLEEIRVYASGDSTFSHDELDAEDSEFGAGFGRPLAPIPTDEETRDLGDSHATSFARNLRRR